MLLLLISQLAALYLTDSRNAWGAAVVAVPLVLGPARWIWLLPVLLLLLLPVLLAVLPGIPELLQLPARAIVPEAIWGRLSDLAFSERPLASTRLGQWSVASAWWLIALGWAGVRRRSAWCIPSGRRLAWPSPQPAVGVGHQLWPASRADARGLGVWLLFARCSAACSALTPLSGAGGQRL